MTRKVITIIIALMLCVSITSCGSKVSMPEDDSSESVSNPDISSSSLANSDESSDVSFEEAPQSNTPSLPDNYSKTT